MAEPIGDKYVSTGRVVGRGTFATVYLGYNKDSPPRQVAIKVSLGNGIARALRFPRSQSVDSPVSFSFSIFTDTSLALLPPFFPGHVSREDEAEADATGARD